MLAVASVLIVATISLLITRVATLALGVISRTQWFNRAVSGDILLLYGRDVRLAELDDRRSGPEGDKGVMP